MKRNKFSLSHQRLLSCNMGELIPIGCVPVLPGDTLQHATSLLLRCSPLLAPVMHPVHVRIHHWYVPLRLVWDDFEDFITGGPDGNDISAMPIKVAPGGGVGVSNLADYLGVPTGVTGLEYSALATRAYQLIWNEWYRDQDLQAEAVVDTASGTDTTTSTALQKVCWEKDYFTSARPWEQKGPQVTLPITGTAPVATGLPHLSGPGKPALRFQKVSDGTSPAAGFALTNNANGDVFQSNTASPASAVSLTPNNLYADMTGVSGISINQFREGLAIQRFEEARARYGSRYTEYLRHLGVRSSDARLQRPEYLGGGKQVIQFSEVLQTAEGEAPVGEMAGHGISAMRSNRYRRFIEEHGYVLSLLSVRPKTIYTQNTPRHFLYRTKEDFHQVELEHIGQQEITNREVYGPHANPTGVFGYQDRYDEYRRMESGVSGEFKNSLLNFWHFARIFGSDPVLNDFFVTCTPTERTFAVQSNDVLYVMARHSIQARRLLSKRGTSFTF